MKNRLRSLLFVLALFAGVPLAFAQGTTAFTYQGQLHDSGTNANGTYTMVFALYNAVANGNQIGSTITTNATLANGLFSVDLDFGAGAFTGSARWLDITITNGGQTQELSPRVQVLPTPYALYAAVAATVTNGAIMNAQLAGNAVNTTNIQNGAITTTQIANGAVTNANLTANAVNATNIASGQVVKSLNGLTDTISLSAGNDAGLITTAGAIQFSSLVPNAQGFTGPTTGGTFTVPTNVTRIEVEMWGAGGGGGSGYNSGGSSGNIGGGGGAGAYSFGIFTVTPGSSYTVNVPGVANGSQNGGSSSFSGPGISMTAGGGGAGGNATSSGYGSGGAGGSASGGSLGNLSGTSGDNAGNGGGIWRGSGISLEQSGKGPNGPGGGGVGGGPGSGGVANAGGAGDSGLVIVYY